MKYIVLDDLEIWNRVCTSELQNILFLQVLKYNITTTTVSA